LEKFLEIYRKISKELFFPENLHHYITIIKSSVRLVGLNPTRMSTKIALLLIFQLG